jgi:hypothetical protein
MAVDAVSIELLSAVISPTQGKMQGILVALRSNAWRENRRITLHLKNLSGLVQVGIRNFICYNGINISLIVVRSS